MLKYHRYGASDTAMRMQWKYYMREYYGEQLGAAEEVTDPEAAEGVRPPYRTLILYEDCFSHTFYLC